LSAEKVYDIRIQNEEVCAICGRPGAIIGKYAILISLCEDCLGHIAVDGDEVYDDRNPSVRTRLPWKVT
jgi:hypothetical protein